LFAVKRTDRKVPEFTARSGPEALPPAARRVGTKRAWAIAAAAAVALIVVGVLYAQQ